MILTTTTDSDAAKKGGYMFSPGFYRAAIVKAEDQVSKAGNEMIVMTVQITSPEGDATKDIFYRLTLMQSMAWMAQSALAACGVTFIKNQCIDVKAKLFLGKKCAAFVCRKEGKDGVVRLEVDRLCHPDTVTERNEWGEIPRDSYGRYKLDSDGVKNTSGGSNRPQTQRNAPPAQAAAPTMEDDDIPF